MKNLKERQDYIDLYDRFTVEECRRIEASVTPEDIQRIAEKQEIKDKYDPKGLATCVNEVHIWCYQGERYKNKDTVITEWMDRDRKMDNCYENAVAPKVSCLKCSRPLSETHKDLRWDHDTNTGRMLFMYDCPNNCLPRRAFYDNGEEWVSKPTLCNKCKTPTTHVTEKTDAKIIWTDTCPACGNVEVDEMELNKKHEEIKPDQYFDADRIRFCDPKKGLEYVNWIANAKELSLILDKHKEREENKDLYDSVRKLKKLSVPQIKLHVTEALKDKLFSNLIFEKPNMDRIVSIGFSIEDSSDQSEYDSRIKFTKLMKKVLSDTNWRLMSDGINYRLGILEGRLRVYEKEEELVKLIQTEQKKTVLR